MNRLMLRFTMYQHFIQKEMKDRIFNLYINKEQKNSNVT